jgi:glycolate oxidase
LRVGEVASDARALEVVVAQSDTQRSKLWATRRELSNVVKKLARHKIAEDVVVPRSKMRQLMEEMSRIGERHGLRTLAYGHAGDGNLHANVLWNEPEEVVRVRAALDDLMRVVVGMGGALTGEHGIGSSKAEYLPLEHGPELRRLEQGVKALFDPKGILNPGKIFPRGGHGGC